MSEQPITKQSFIDAFTQRPDGTGAMPADELLQRLDMILNSIKADAASNEKRLPVHAANSLRGALIRLAQAYGNAQVEEKVRELVSITADITGI